MTQTVFIFVIFLKFKENEALYSELYFCRHGQESYEFELIIHPLIIVLVHLSTNQICRNLS